MKELSALSSNFFHFRYGSTDVSDTSASFAERSIRHITVKSTKLAESTKAAKSSQMKRDREKKTTKELEDILFDKFGISITKYAGSKSKLMQVTISLIHQIKNPDIPIRLSYGSNDFRDKISQLKNSIEDKDLSSTKRKRIKQKLLLDEIKELLNVNVTVLNSHIQILSAACDYLNNYLKQISPLEEKETNVSKNFGALNKREVIVNPTRIKRDRSKGLKKDKEIRIINNQATQKLADILFYNFGVYIHGYHNSRNRLIDVTIYIINQIKNQVEPIKLTYGEDFFLQRKNKMISLIKESNLSSKQLRYRYHNLLLNELKATLNIDVKEKIVYEQIISSACNYLNDYLNKNSNFTAGSDDDMMHVPCSTQPVKPQPLSQSSIPSISLPREEELTIAEQSSLIRLKNALNKYPLPDIDIENFGELLFAAAYCIKMNSNMMQVSELDYNQHYVKHFYAPYPYDNPRDEIEDHLDDLEKALSVGSMDLVIKQNPSHQREALPETGDLENTSLNSFVDAFEPEAVLTTDSLNLLLENFDDEASSARAKKILAALDLAAQYLENEEYIDLQNLLANEDLPTYEDLSIYEELIDDEPVAKKIKVG